MCVVWGGMLVLWDKWSDGFRGVIIRLVLIIVMVKVCVVSIGLVVVVMVR